MDFYEVIRTRRSVRAYRSDPVPEPVLGRVLDAARIAPSGSNRQPTRLVLVQDRERQLQLVPLCGGQDFVAEAPVLVAACGRDIHYSRGGYMGAFSMLIDVAIAVDHLTLAARAEGLGTCWIGSFDNARLKEFFNLPDEYNVVTLTPLGYPVGNPFAETADRLPLRKFACRETWDF